MKNVSLVKFKTR